MESWTIWKDNIIEKNLIKNIKIYIEYFTFVILVPNKNSAIRGMKTFSPPCTVNEEDQNPP